MSDDERRHAHAAHRVHRRPSSPIAPICSTHVVPTYPPGAKRMLRDNGVWARTLKRDNVAPRHGRDRRDHAERASSWPTASEHEVDVIIYGTGFQASKFLTPMR